MIESSESSRCRKQRQPANSLQSFQRVTEELLFQRIVARAGFKWKPADISHLVPFSIDVRVHHIG